MGLEWHAEQTRRLLATTQSRYAISDRDRHAQERCRNRGSVIARACVLGVEEGVQFGLQIGLATIGGCSFERVHGRSVVRPERSEEVRWCAWVVECVGIPREGDLLFGHTRGRESL